MSNWEPYFRPTTRVHDSGFRCFECGYLEIGDDKKAERKVVIASGVDHIGNLYFCTKAPTQVDMDLLKDGNIRLFCYGKKLFWHIPGFSDAWITDQIADVLLEYENLDEMWRKQNDRIKKGGDDAG